MVHIIFTFYLLALLAGTAALSQSLLFYRRYRKLVIRHFLLFLLSLCLILVSFIVQAYARIAALPPQGAAADISWLAGAAGGLTFIFGAPYFYASLLGFELPRGWKICFSSLDGVVVALTVTSLARPAWHLPTTILSGTLFGMILLGIVLIIVRLPSVGEEALKTALLVFLTVTAVFFPFLLIDAMVGLVEWLSVFRFLDGTVLPLYLLTVSGLAILFGLRYLNRPAFWVGGQLSDYFVDAHHITAREREIIGALLSGRKASEIGDRLFISSKTVENHIYSVYQKLGVRNRVQLFQLVKANSA